MKERFLKAGLVLEGGGMRGVYTSGVLDGFLKAGMHFSYAVGVSAGASNGVSYISRQLERNRRVNINYVRDPRFLGMGNWLREGSLFGMKFLFDTLPNELEPFDYEAFFRSPTAFWITATDCEEGNPLYFEKSDLDQQDLMRALTASTSLPFASPMVEFRGRKLLDGGIADSIPIEKSLSDGNKQNIVVLTRNAGYRKTPSRFGFLAKLKYGKFPRLAECLEQRYAQYNASLDRVEELEREGKVFVIRPQKRILVGRMEKDRSKLEALYREGMQEVETCRERLLEWLG